MAWLVNQSELDKIKDGEITKETKQKIKKVKAKEKQSEYDTTSLNKLTPNTVKGIIIAIYGKWKEGKTLCAASASLKKGTTQTPFFKVQSGAPIVILDTEDAAYWVPQFYPEEYNDGIIRIESVTVPKKPPKDKDETLFTNIVDPAAKPMLDIDKARSFDKFVEELNKLHDFEGTIIIDCATDATNQWLNYYLRTEILKLEPLNTGSGFQKDIKFSDWWWRNDKFESIMKYLRSLKANVIMTFRADDEIVAEYANVENNQKLVFKKTGNITPQWNKKTPYWADFIMEIRTEMIEQPDGKQKSIRVGYMKGGRVPMEHNLRIEKPNFEKICKLIGTSKPKLDF